MKKDTPSSRLKYYPFQLRRAICRRLKDLGIEGSPEDYATVERIWKCVGDRPEPTDLRRPVLCIRDGEKPYPQNFYWKWYFRPEVISDIMSHDTRDTKFAFREYVRAALASLTDDEIRDARKNGLQRKVHVMDYRKHIGRTFGTLRVISVSQKECNGIAYYIYTVRCTRCGACYTRGAYLFIHGRAACKHCGYRYARANKNSAVVWNNKYGRYALKWKAVADPGLSARLLMNNYTGEYTVFHGTPEYMEARIDADLLGITGE